MEKIFKQTPENNDEKSPNFHELSEIREELRKAVSDLGSKDNIASKYCKKPLADIDEKASKFKMSDFGGLKGLKEF